MAKESHCNSDWKPKAFAQRSPPATSHQNVARVAERSPPAAPHQNVARVAGSSGAEILKLEKR
ncbi:hypothetical protein [Paenibacillus kribbensis]|uniref:hypothetical protein n=1 Tax=Paenibacillus kribbensis TaxID=172713 RepID=UPI00114CE2B8|nr:hypothetical protein [Paenibacillus kribbensis]